MSDRSFTIPGSPALEGIWQGSGTPVVVIAPPHPLMGGHLSNPVVQAIASGAVDAGRRALAFNFRGVGDSSGDASADPEDADSDFRSVLAHAVGSGQRAVVASYSFGGAAALRVAFSDERVSAVVAVAPPPALLGSGAPLRQPTRVAIISAEHDQFAPAESLTKLAADLSARFDVIHGADHFFGTGLRRIREIVREVLGTLP